MSYIGRYTGCDLRGVTPLYMPWKDVNGQLRPPLSLEAAKLSLELASAAYDMKLDGWREAGWQDISYQVDNKLLSGAAVNGGASGGFSGVISDYYQFLAKARLRQLNPISQLRGALRQREGSDTCKAIVMAHAVPGGKYLVAIGFMGTGKRFYDWISNFRVRKEEGVHAGFLQLAREFEKNYESISFPETAKALGLDKLTLGDVLKECHRPGSRFRLWLAGHSQGGAIMQLIALREMRRGLLRQNMIGYSFASPSAVYDNPRCDPCALPLYHIINADDVFPRMGAVLHMGRCLVFHPDDEMRAVCYGDAFPRPAFQSMLRMTAQITDSGEAFLLVLGALLALQEMAPEESMSILNGFIGSVIPEKLLPALGTRREDLLRALIQRVKQSYAQATGGSPIPQERLLLLRLRLKELMTRLGGQAFLRGFKNALGLPHKLRGRHTENGDASYQYIVTQRFRELKQQTWRGPVSRMEPAGRRQARPYPAGRFARLSGERARRQAASTKRRKL